MKKLIICSLLVSMPAYSQTLREKIKERMKERFVQREAKKPAPESEVATDAKVSKPGDYTFSFSHNGKTRMYRMHIPNSYKETTAVPLLVAMHGGGGDMEHQSKDALYKQISKSDELGYVVVFPNGFSKLNSGKFATWNAGKCCGGARDTHSDDVGFIKELINKVEQQVSVDKNKVFATGMSNGGMMSYRLACEMSDVFKGIAAVAGTDNTVECQPKNPISILHIHAKNDDHVLFNGGAGKGLERNAEAVTDFVSVPNTISKWVKFNGCGDTPKRALEKEGAYCDLYSGCKNNVEVKLCVTDTGAHSWPGGAKPRGEAPSQVISANDMMWDFFKGK